MNKFILNHKTLVTSVILAILAWFIYRQFIVAKSPLFPFAAVVVVVWVLGTLLFIYLWPRITYLAYKRAILRDGLGGGPVPINTLYATPELSSSTAPSSSLLATGTSDLLYFGGWLDLANGPQILHTPDMADRYYSIQFTDPSDGANFAYVGTRTTGSREGEYLIYGPGWHGSAPQETQPISSPSNTVLVVGRVMVENDNDAAAAYALAKQFSLTPLRDWQGNR